jgi:protein-tyrosine-phosphatase
MAEGIARHLAAVSGREDLEFSSAGVGAADGFEASENAVAVARKNGIDLGDHRSKRLTASMLERADLIVAMEKSHMEAIRRMKPQTKDRTVLLHDLNEAEEEKGKDVVDPIGGDEATYWNTFFEIRELVEALLSRAHAMGR